MRYCFDIIEGLIKTFVFSPTTFLLLAIDEHFPICEIGCHTRAQHQPISIASFHRKTSNYLLAFTGLVLDEGYF